MLLGIGLGSWNSCIAIQTADDASVEVIANAEGDRVIPTCVHWGRDKLCGTIAKQYAVRHAQNTIYDFCQLLGGAETDELVQQWRKKYPMVQLEFDAAGELCVVFPAPPSDDDDGNDDDGDGDGQRTLSITQVMADYLKYLSATAEAYAGVSVSAAVITKPVAFSAKQCEALCEAARLAGLPLLCLLDDPVAAINTHRGTVSSACNPDHDRVFAVLDLGATVTTLSLVAVRSGVLVLLQTDSTAAISGLAIDALVQKFFGDEFHRKYKMNVLESRRSRIKLLAACEQIKVTLSKAANAFINVDSLHEGVDFHSSIHRLRFEGLCDQPLAALQAFVRKCIAAAGVSLTEIDETVMVGGVSQIPIVQQRLKRDFDWRSRLDADPIEVFALGAVAEAQTILQCKADGFVAADACSALAGLKTVAFARHTYGLVSRSDCPAAERAPTPPAADGSTVDEAADVDGVIAMIHAGQPLPVQQSAELEVECGPDGSAYIAIVRQMADAAEIASTPQHLIIRSKSKVGEHVWRIVDAVRLEDLDADAATEMEVTMTVSAEGVLAVSLMDKQSSARLDVRGQ